MNPLQIHYTQYFGCRRATLLSIVLNNTVISFVLLYLVLQLALLAFGVKASAVPTEMVLVMLLGTIALAWTLKLLARRQRWTDRFYKHCTQNRKG